MKKYSVTRIDDETFMITERIGGVHCYLLTGEEEALLIDTGNGVGDLAELVKGLTCAPVTVVNTHGHLDHIGGNFQFDTVALPAGEEDIVRLHTDARYIERSFRKMLPWILRIAVRMLVPQMITPHAFQARYDLQDGDRIALGGREIRVISAAGHSPAAVCYFDEKRNYLFVGDSVGNNTVLLNLAGCSDLDVYRASLDKLRDFVDEKTRLFPGHTDSPISTEFLDRFISCAEAAANGTAKFYRGAESGSECLYAEKDGVRIALKPEFPVS